MGSSSIRFGSVFGSLDSSNTSEPIGRRTGVVAVVVDQGMFGCKSCLGLVKLCRLVAGYKKGFQQRDLSVFVEVGVQVRDAQRQVLSEPLVLLVSALRGRDDHSVFA